MRPRGFGLASAATCLFCLTACSDGHKVGDDEARAHDDAGASGSGSGSDGPCADRAGKLRGKSTQMLSVGDVTRSFVYYAPESLKADQPAPLVIAVHGFAMSGETMYTVTGFKELADKEGFVAVFPDGASFASPWNVGTGIMGVSATLSGKADDQAFLDAILEFTDDDQCLDREHVFVTGFSMGGYFSNESGCLRDDLAGIAPHSGGSHDLSACPGSIKPVILFHGEVDGVVSYPNAGLVTRDRWRTRNGCGSEFDLEMVESGALCEYYKDCPERAQVALCHFPELEHKWAGGNDPSYWYGDPDRASAAQLAWDFWRKYAW